MEAEKRKIRIIAISDTHVKHKEIQPHQLPPADIFIHAGDFTRMSRVKQFIKALPYKHKIVIPGNHDFGLETDLERYKLICDKFGVREKERVNPAEQIKQLKKICTLLMHEEVQVQGLKIFGSQYVISDHLMGFTYEPGQGHHVWANLPQKVDILVTHCPPFGIHDISKHNNSHTGCKDLLQAVQQMKPKVHIFGHIHESFGQSTVNGIRFYNVGYLDEHYKVKNNPVLIQLEVDQISK